jgi:hypothetical protein
MLYYTNDGFRKGKVLNCFMRQAQLIIILFSVFFFSHMMYRGEPFLGMQKCLDSMLAPPEAKASIVYVQ